MKKLRVGVWLYKDKISPEMGGAYGYYNELINAINKHSFKDTEIVFLSNEEISIKQFNCKKIFWKQKKLTLLNFFLIIAKNISPSGIGVYKIKESINKEIKKLRTEVDQYADVIYYPIPVCIYPDVPYVYTLWDLGHITSYAFPEISMDGNFEQRKIHHDTIPQKALMIFAESEAGKKECEQYLRINRNKINVIPIFSSNVISSECKAIKPSQLDENAFFIHYPAQYSAHKNHFNLLEAMPAIVKEFPGIQLVLSGSKGNNNYITHTISELGLEKSVLELDFVSQEELRWLYEHSHGLVFPSLLGPTNMPLIEAATLGCPVACTNLSGHIEQLGEYGYYFNGLNSDDIAKQIIQMIRDKKNGFSKKYKPNFTIETAIEAIDKAFTELRSVRFCWGHDWCGMENKKIENYENTDKNKK
jgi:glycosyltransferase involved in cell wall biosynthesis